MLRWAAELDAGGEFGGGLSPKGGRRMPASSAAPPAALPRVTESRSFLIHNSQAPLIVRVLRPRFRD